MDLLLDGIMLPHRWILEIQVMPAKSNFIYMDSDENIWFRISGATIKKKSTWL